MKCPYQPDLTCRYVDTLDMTSSKDCGECECYGDGSRPTGCFKSTVVIATCIILILIWLI